MTHIEEMNRIQVIEELRSKAHPTWFHSLLRWSTPRLKALLLFYRESDKEEQSIQGSQLGITLALHLFRLEKMKN